MLRRLKSGEGPWAALGGNETEALEAAGDCQSAFTRPGCAVAGIKELAGQPLCRAGLSGSEWRRVTPRNQLYNSGQSEDYENVEELKQLCWRPSSHMRKDVWCSEVGFRNHRLLSTVCPSQEGLSDRVRAKNIACW